VNSSQLKSAMRDIASNDKVGDIEDKVNKVERESEENQ
jgi:hypothetical protein